ncbi:Na(+)/H(+) antiporter subunit F1 [Staphylococcus pragensis]|uniref:Na(+)/H(+) antiporter subunit F1 n=1 Tax=Staphylococcus pragensis TaxID=1611836 RepID=A0A4Z1B3V9_9STAP|nr:Na(+)/H(+) antiporter subunit F1 [Staphylococcus pragensis]RTX90739.1 Na(+)/H(+) antiporter subunit F1 [Staphylococcus carnosus]TGN28313.1 Na(+)/H(+) antiporter subunit F1 [Staphylococcus pragensis]GGG88491.1 Na(+)/H(+) antiporter subunit F1 [Staphylococcus pragensis]
MVKFIMLIALIVVVLSMLAIFIRIIKGSTLADRILALDAVGLQLMACVALYSIFIGAQYLLVTILLIGILAFLGTAVFSKYIDKGKVIEHDINNHD